MYEMKDVVVGDVVVVNNRRGEPMSTVKVEAVAGHVVVDSDGNRWARSDGKRLPRKKGNETFITKVDPQRIEALERTAAEMTVFRFYDRMRKPPAVGIEHLRAIVAAIESAEIPPVSNRR